MVSEVEAGLTSARSPTPTVAPSRARVTGIWLVRLTIRSRAGDSSRVRPETSGSSAPASGSTFTGKLKFASRARMPEPKIISSRNPVGAPGAMSATTSTAALSPASSIGEGRGIVTLLPLAGGLATFAISTPFQRRRSRSR